MFSPFLKWKCLVTVGPAVKTRYPFIYVFFFLYLLEFRSCKLKGSTNRNSRAENEANRISSRFDVAGFRPRICCHLVADGETRLVPGRGGKKSYIITNNTRFACKVPEGILRNRMDEINGLFSFASARSTNG